MENISLVAFVICFCACISSIEAGNPTLALANGALALVNLLLWVKR